MGLKGYLYRKLKGRTDEDKARRSDENRTRRINESTIRKQQYEKIYAEQYRKQLEQQAKKERRKEGLVVRTGLRPQRSSISNALYGMHPALIPRPVGQIRKTKQRGRDLADIL